MTQRLTVILPVYNGMPFLPEAVESILQQSFTDFTFIVINDGSTDGTEHYLSTLNDPRIVIVNQINQGIGAALNCGLRMCLSEYVARMDADDISLVDRFASQIIYLDAHPEVVMLGTQIEFLIGNASQRALCAPLNHNGIDARLRKGRAGVCHPSLMFRTAAAIACGGYPTGVFGEDIDFFLRMCEQGLAANLDQVLLQYRLQGLQASMSKTQEVIRFNHYAVHRAIVRRKGLSEPTLDDFVRNASIIDRCRWSIEAWELIQYRTARIQIASGRAVNGFLRIALLGLCRPIATIGRIAGVLRILQRKSTG